MLRVWDLQGILVCKVRIGRVFVAAQLVIPPMGVSSLSGAVSGMTDLTPTFWASASPDHISNICRTKIFHFLDQHSGNALSLFGLPDRALIRALFLLSQKYSASLRRADYMRPAVFVYLFFCEPIGASGIGTPYPPALCFKLRLSSIDKYPGCLCQTIQLADARVAREAVD